MSWVFDSTPLIYLCKVSLSWIFKELSGEKIIPEAVFEQVVSRGKERGEGDAFLVEQLIKDRVLTVEEVSDGSGTVFKAMEEELHEGEIDVLRLAMEKKGIAITDEGIAREIGEMFGVEVHGTFYLIFLMIAKGKMTKSDAKIKMEEMIKKGWRVGHEQYLEFVELLESMSSSA
ncbi:MAG: DUF3368 domain-containing protein [Candidatus Hydrothermarchaeales archaeon]